MADMGAEIEAVKGEWGRRLLILAHHYQRPSVLRFADCVGDSLELARSAAAHPEAERIVFCGVHFMAESADVLTGPDQTVYMPATEAGCPMADMATAAQMEAAWRVLQAQGGDWLPVVYVNSSAAIKACCGRWGGSACTSSNASRVLAWVFGQGRRALFLPDRHLGENTAHDLGVPDDEVLVYDPAAENGGLEPGRLRRARVVVWKGHCIVHLAFTAEQVRRAREQWPAARIIVHPEAPREVVRLCDAHGSTAQIIRYVEGAPDGSTVVVGTELNLVERLADTHRARLTVKALAPSVCANMAKTNPRNLHALLTAWPDDRIVRVPPAVAEEARACLRTMLAL